VCNFCCSGYEGYTLKVAEGPTTAGKIDNNAATTLARVIFQLLGQQAQASQSKVQGEVQPSEFHGASININTSQPLVNEPSNVLPTWPADQEPFNFVNETSTVSCGTARRRRSESWSGNQLPA
jgi:hypothetical protein